MKVLLAKIYVDMDEVKLPNFVYTMEGLMEEGCDFIEAQKLMKEKFGVQIEDPNSDCEFEEKVPKETVEKYKQKLVEKLRDDVKVILEMYRDGEIDPSMGEAMNEASGGIYMEPPDDLFWDSDVKLEIDTNDS